MNENKFKELLLENNKILVNEIDKKTDQKIEKAMKKMNEAMDQKIGIAMQKMNETMDQKIESALNESEKRQNSKLAYLEFTYGEKISAIFDKIQSIEDIMKRQEKENQKYRKSVDHHGDILYSHDFRISKLEDKVSSI